VKKFYKCVRGIDEYISDTHYFISGKVYERVGDITDPNIIVNSDLVILIDELGDNHRMPSDIFETHFKPLTSNKRRRNDKERR
jgi:hypothetical protein